MRPRSRSALGALGICAAAFFTHAAAALGDLGLDPKAAEAWRAQQAQEASAAAAKAAQSAAAGAAASARAATFATQQANLRIATIAAGVLVAVMVGLAVWFLVIVRGGGKPGDEADSD
jgi:hypothetical protein